MHDKKVHHKSMRIKLLIYPKFQLRLIGANVGLMLVAVGFITLQLHRAFYALKQMGEAAKIPVGHPYFRFLDWELGQMYSFFAIAFLTAIIISAVLTLSISNKLAGPIVRLRRYFHEIAVKGRSADGQIRFRDGDFFPELPIVINDALKRLREERKRVAHHKKAA